MKVAKISWKIFECLDKEERAFLRTHLEKCQLADTEEKINFYTRMLVEWLKNNHQISGNFAKAIETILKDINIPEGKDKEAMRCLHLSKVEEALKEDASLILRLSSRFHRMLRSSK